MLSCHGYVYFFLKLKNFHSRVAYLLICIYDSPRKMKDEAEDGLLSTFQPWYRMSKNLINLQIIRARHLQILGIKSVRVRLLCCGLYLV